MRKESESPHSSAPIFSSARFDEDSIIVYPLLTIVTAGLYFSGFPYFALIPALLLAMIFAVEISERVILVPLKKVQVLGNKCMVMKRVSYGEKGVVKIVDNAGISQWELWSAESNYDFEEGSIARVKKVDGLYLQIEPL
jgi:membrane protein implicated in regulation of membrane protease activity